MMQKVDVTLIEKAVDPNQHKKIEEISLIQIYTHDFVREKYRTAQSCEDNW